MGLEDQENEGENENCNMSCLVAIGRMLPHISTVAAAAQSRPNVRPVQFISRHALDGKFLFIDQRWEIIFLIAFMVSLGQTRVRGPLSQSFKKCQL